MKQFLLAVTAILLQQMSYGQVAISNPASAPGPSAMLDVKSTSKGFLMPRVTNRANVAAPAAGLMIYETATNSVLVYSGSSWTQLGSGSSSQWLTNGTHIYNGNTGNVGIGVTAPNAKLHLSGLLKIDGGQIDIDDNIAQVRLLYNGSPKGYFSLSSSSGDIQIGTNVGANDAGKLQLETKSFPRVTILPDGNVGIGHINPSEKLYVNGNIRTTARVDAEGVIEGAGLSSNGVLYVNGTSLLQGGVTGNATASFNGNINSNTGMSITDAAGIIQFKNGATDKIFMQLNGNDMRLGTNSGNDNGNFIARVNGQDVMKITPTYNVGIGLGAANPAAKFHVEGNIFAHANGEAIKLDGVGPTINFSNAGVFKSFITQSSSQLYIGSNGDLRIDATGQVAIGNINANGASYKLAVDGRVICEELRVKLSQNWPDYVFSKTYKLRPLSALKDFIDANNRLPNIPAASVMEKEGIAIGDMQKKLMEKIEELTLYIIDLQKQIDELKTKTGINKNSK